MSDTIKAGIIGFGFMGSTHFNIYRDMSDVEVVAIADVDLKKRQGDISSVKSNISGGSNDEIIDFSSLNIYADGIELIANPDIDLLDICLPVFLHKQFALAALAAGKHVLCEKPLAMNSDDAVEIIAMARKSDKVFMVGMCVRYWPEYHYVINQYKAGKYGRIHSAFFKRFSPTVAGSGWNNWFADRKMSGGALLEMHLHDTDQVLQFFGRPERVNSTGCRGVRSKDCWDHVFTVYDYGDGSMIVSEGGWTAASGTPFEMSYQLIGELATVIFNQNGLNIYYEDGRHEQPDLGGYPYQTGWHGELAHLISLIKSGETTEKESLSDIVDGISIIEAELESVEHGKSAKVNYKDI